MIVAADFVDRARDRGYDWYAGVPCSFLTPLINYVIGDKRLVYLASSNEGDAVATAAGAVLGGRRAVVMMQNSGLGNAVNPITSLTYPFRIPVLIIVTLRGDPDLSDEPQHELMGRITGQLLTQMNILWEYFPAKSNLIDAALDRADEHMTKHRRPYALVMRHGTVAQDNVPSADLGIRSRFDGNAPKVIRYGCGTRAQSPMRDQILRRIVHNTRDDSTVIIATTGYTGRELFAIADRATHLYMVGSMGCASSFGLGLALTRPDLCVVVIDGDGAALMRMGNLATVGTYSGPNLFHILLDNQAHDSTGAQGTVSGTISFSRIAEACGYETVLDGNDPTLVDNLFNSQQRWGAAFAHIKICLDTTQPPPRPNLKPYEVFDRLASHIRRNT